MLVLCDQKMHAGINLQKIFAEIEVMDTIFTFLDYLSKKKIDNHEIAKMINFTLYKLLVKGDMKLHQEANNRWNYFGHAVCHSIKANAAGCDK